MMTQYRDHMTIDIESGSRNLHMTIALQLFSLLDVSPVKRIAIFIGSLVKNFPT